MANLLPQTAKPRLLDKAIQTEQAAKEMQASKRLDRPPGFSPPYAEQPEKATGQMHASKRPDRPPGFPVPQASKRAFRYTCI